MQKALVVLLFVICVATGVRAENRPEFRVQRAGQPPQIDGILNDEVWQQAPLQTGDWIAYNPVRGGKSDKRTDVRIAYDDRYLYFGIHCFDNEPDKIRTTISRRDTAFNDDWFALSLDSAGTGQTAYHLFVNPSGIQMDALNTSASGEQFEADFVWDSAAKIVDDGYTVEIRVPLQSIRFSGGEHVRMGILFFRKISRTGLSYSWPEILPGQWVSMANSQLQRFLAILGTDRAVSLGLHKFNNLKADEVSSSTVGDRWPYCRFYEPDK